MSATQQRSGTISQRKALRILAKSISKELRAQGYDDRQIVSLASELIDDVTDRAGATRRD